MSRARRGLLAVAGAAVLWSLAGLGVKSVPEPALTVACLRSAVAAVALALLLRPRLPRWSPALVAALVGSAGNVITFVVATKWTTAANAIFLQYTGVLWVLLLAPVLLDEPLRSADLAAVAVAFVGLGLFFVGGIDTDARAGDGIALLSGLFFAMLILALRRVRDGGGEAAVTLGNALVAIVLLPFVAGDLPVPARSMGLLALLGTVQVAGAYALFVRGIRDVPAARASLVGMLEPVLNPVWVFLVVGEVPRLATIVGGAVVLGAIGWRTMRLRGEEGSPPTSNPGTLRLRRPGSGAG